MKKLLFVAACIFAFPAWAQAPAEVDGCQYLLTPPTLSDLQTTSFRCDTTGALVIAGSISAVSSLTATAAAPSYVEGTTDPFSSDLSGNLRVILPANQSVDVAKINGVTPLMGNGVVGTGSPRVAIADIGTGEYETVAASQTNQALGATGAAGDYLLQLVCTPATTSPGVVTVLDNAISLVAFPGGASSVSNLLPFVIPINAYSVSGAWKVTTGANVSCVGVGNFT